MQKEKLTFEKIKSDYKAQFFNDMGFHLIVTCFPLFFLAIIFTMWFHMKGTLTFPAFLVIATLCWLAYICFAALGEHYKKYQQIKKGAFRIVTDKLVAVDEKRTYVGSFSATFSRPYILHFASYGRYCIPEKKNNSFSKKFHMSDKGIYYNSHIDDIFYLVINKKEEILLAYNTHFFDLV